jgi:hypothetical protein
LYPVLKISESICTLLFEKKLITSIAISLQVRDEAVVPPRANVFKNDAEFDISLDPWSYPKNDTPEPSSFKSFSISSSVRFSVNLTFATFSSTLMLRQKSIRRELGATSSVPTGGVGDRALHTSEGPDAKPEHGEDNSGYDAEVAEPEAKTRPVKNREGDMKSGTNSSR